MVVRLLTEKMAVGGSAQVQQPAGQAEPGRLAEGALRDQRGVDGQRASVWARS